MESYICRTCGVQYSPSDAPPPRCIICEDERQYIGWEGQQWTTLAEMKAAGYRNEFREHEAGLIGIGTRPHFAIGQRSLLVQTPNGNFLWDGISYIDDETIDRINALGGIHGLSASHPHFYGSLVEYSHAFDSAPVYIPQADSQWVTRPDPAIRYWQHAQEVLPGLTLVQCGGHFEGSAVLHWAAGAEGRGAILTGDTISVVQDRRYVSFMYSYPNYMPLSAKAVQRIVESVRPYRFDRIYGGWWGSVLAESGMQAIETSAERYIRLIQG